MDRYDIAVFDEHGEFQGMVEGEFSDMTGRQAFHYCKGFNSRSDETGLVAKMIPVGIAIPEVSEKAA